MRCDTYPQRFSIICLPFRFQLDQLRAGLQDVLYNLNWLKNATTPIARLPNELLCRVFDFAIVNGPASRQCVLLHITRICHRWRSTAIQNATFWANIFIKTENPSSVDQALAFLTRSQGASLELRLENPILYPRAYPYLVQLMGQLSQNATRIKRCSISCDQALPLLKMMQFPTPNLEVLELKPHSKSTPSIALPSLFGDHFPRLKALELIGYIAWPSSRFKNLTELSLCSVPWNPQDITHLLDLLQDSPGLVALKLEDVWPDQDRPVTPRSIPLFSLRLLLIKRCRSPLILSHLLLPPQVQSDISGCYLCDDRDDAVYETATIFSVLPNKSSPFEGAEGLKIRFVDDNLTLVWSNAHGDITIDQDLGNLPSYDVLLRSLRKIASRSIFQAIRSLDLFLELHGAWADEVGLPTIEWGDFFDRLTQLKHLTIHLEKTQDLLEDLSRNGLNDTVRCPLLESVSIDAGPAHLEDGENHLTVLDLISEFAQARVSAGCKLCKLTVLWYLDVPVQDALHRLENLADSVEIL
jgi:hypothetical protein